MSTVINFAAARRRIESIAAMHEALAPDVVEIEIAASRIPVEVTFCPKATFLEIALRKLSDAELSELVRTVLDESR